MADELFWDFNDHFVSVIGQRSSNGMLTTPLIQLTQLITNNNISIHKQAKMHHSITHIISNTHKRRQRRLARQHLTHRLRRLQILMRNGINNKDMNRTTISSILSIISNSIIHSTLQQLTIRQVNHHIIIIANILHLNQQLLLQLMVSLQPIPQ